MKLAQSVLSCVSTAAFGLLLASTSHAITYPIVPGTACHALTASEEIYLERTWDAAVRNTHSSAYIAVTCPIQTSGATAQQLSRVYYWSNKTSSSFYDGSCWGQADFPGSTAYYQSNTAYLTGTSGGTYTSWNMYGGNAAVGWALSLRCSLPPSNGTSAYLKAYQFNQ